MPIPTNLPALIDSLMSAGFPLCLAVIFFHSTTCGSTGSWLELIFAELNLIWIGRGLVFSKNTKGLPWANIARSVSVSFFQSAVTDQSEKASSTVSFVSIP